MTATLHCTNDGLHFTVKFVEKAVYVGTSYSYPFSPTLSPLTAWMAHPYVLHFPKAWFLVVLFLYTFFLTNLTG